MKKFITMICLLLTVILSVPFLSACSPKQEGGKSVVLCDFEQWGPDFLTMRLGSYFGDVKQYEKQGDDDVFVKSGKYSAKMRPLGRNIQDIRPSMYFPTIINSENFKFSYNDFTEIDNVSFSMYLDSNEDFSVRISLVIGVTSPNGYTTADYTEFELKKQTWNEIKYTVDHAALGKCYDITNIYGVAINFPIQPDENIENSPVIYVDDVILNYRASKAAYNPNVSLENNEIAFFENADNYDHYKATRPYTPYTSEEAGVVAAADYDFLGRTSGHLFRITTTPGQYSKRLSSNLVVSEKLMRNTTISTVTRGLLARSYIKFDIYMKSENPEDVFTLFVILYSKENKTNVSQFFYIPANTWTSVEEPLQTFTYKNTGNPGELVIRFLEYEDTEFGNLEFFIDNIRLDLATNEG